VQEAGQCGTRRVPERPFSLTDSEEPICTASERLTVDTVDAMSAVGNHPIAIVIIIIMPSSVLPVIGALLRGGRG
jgi:hypothetical protein